ncbi:MAG: Ig-like domain repeat protein [Lachnospiraceae bacterium]|nr:Ig-like domain repeat protein [Lachnospiraceae bacterium]
MKARGALAVLAAAAAVCLILPAMHIQPVQAKDQGVSILLAPSAPAADNGIPNVYGYYNRDSDVSVDVLVQAEGEEGFGIRKIEAWITDESQRPEAVTQMQVLYEDGYVEESAKPEPEEPEPVEPEPVEPEPEEPEPEEPIPEEPEPDEPEPEKPEPHQFLTRWEGKVAVDKVRLHSNEVAVHVRTTDCTGSVKENAVRLEIDTDVPVVWVSYDNNTPFASSCYGSIRTATIRVQERNFDPNGADVAITNSAGTVPVTGGWRRSVTGTGEEEPVYFSTVTFEADGDYTLAVSCVDAAGNRSEGVLFAEGTTDGEAFTIDRTKPLVTVSYDNDRAANDRYFRAPRTAYVVITEHNFDMELVDLKQTYVPENGQSAAPSVSWQHDGDIHKATVRFSGDGDYTFDVSLTDLAGNKNAAADYGDSRAAREFTIDTTQPDVQITGVEDECAYRGAVAPIVRFDDPNFDDCELSLTRTRMDETDIDVTEQFLSESERTDRGGNAICRSPEKSRDNDGIYTLHALVSDLAGNEREETVTFSVNRFGSVYVFGDYLISLIKNGGIYTQKIEEDLVITEYNVNRLVKGSMLLDITKDGRPMTDISWILSSGERKTASAGRHGWQAYQYTIKKENFEKDGVYKMSISSKDEAGNTADNTKAAGTDILFRVDSTAPEIMGTVKTDENGILAEGENFEYSVYDTIGLKSIELYVNDENASYEISEFGEDANHYAGSLSLEGTLKEQEVRLVARDLAGNITDINYGVPPGIHTFQELIASPAAALEQLAGDGVWFPIAEGAAAAAAFILILLAVRKKRS